MLRSLPRLLAASLLSLAAHHAPAQEVFPAKPVRIILPFAAGGGSDAVTRLLAREMAVHLGQPVVVDNRGGAGGNVGMEAAARSMADGYTIVMMAQSASASPFLYKNSVDPLKDVVPIGLVVKYHEVLVVNANSPMKNVADLVQRAKSKPGTLTFGSSGAGGLSHLAAEHMARLSGISLVHVPYKGVGPAMNDLLGGQIDLMFDIVATTRPHVSAGKLRALGVSSRQRLASMPDVPAMSESLPGMTLSGWLGLAAPSGTPEDRVARLTRALDAALRTPAVQHNLVEGGYEAATTADPKAFGQLIRTDLEFYGKLLPAIGLKPE